MGNICLRGLFDSHSAQPEPAEPKLFSWETRGKVDMSAYTVEGVRGGEAGRTPGQVAGQQMIVRDCSDARLYLLDHSNTITVDDCTDCLLVLGPVRGSVFIRDCVRCVLVTACGQFRTRDCRDTDVYLFCATQPIIEASTGMRFACCRLSYPQLRDQFTAAGLNMFHNSWSNLHDFTPVEGEQNWTLIPPAEPPDSRLTPPTDPSLASVGLSLEAAASLVPQTESRARSSGEMALVLFFPDGQQEQRAAAFHSALVMAQRRLVLACSREVLITPLQLETLLNTSAYSPLVQKQPLIAAQYCGPDVIRHCQTAAMETITCAGLTGQVYVSSSPQSATVQVDALFRTHGQVQM